MDWINRTNLINAKLTKINKAINAGDILTPGACVISDYECSQKLLQVPQGSWEKLLSSLYELEQWELAHKVEMLLCYISELKRLAGVNVKELIGLTRDDVTAMQRVCVMKKNATDPKTKFKTIETLTSLLDSVTEAEENAQYLKTKQYQTAVA